MYSCLIFLILIPWRYSTCLNYYFDANLDFDWFQNVFFQFFPFQVADHNFFIFWKMIVHFLPVFRSSRAMFCALRVEFHLPLNRLIPPARNKRRKMPFNSWSWGFMFPNQGQSRNHKVGQLLDKFAVHRLSIDKIMLTDIKF